MVSAGEKAWTVIWKGWSLDMRGEFRCLKKKVIRGITTNRWDSKVPYIL